MHRLISATLLACNFAWALSPHEIVHRADLARAPQGSYSMLAKVQNHDGEVSEYKVSVKNQRVSLVEQLVPERLRGRKLLMLDENLWFSTPNIKRPTRVSFEQRLTGEVANGDLTRTAFAEDYDAVLMGEEKINGEPSYKLHLKANKANVTYSKIDYFVGKNHFFPLKAQFYALSGKLLKTAIYSDIRAILGHSTITKIVIQDYLQADHKSILTFTNFHRGNMSDALFSKESLSQ